MKSLIALLAALACGVNALGQTDSFALKKGDRVVFYGDSITDLGPYTYFIETYVAERYPKLRVTFTNSGVGGDKVSGGWMGPIDERLTRDVFAHKPTVLTIMLGMNDGLYKPWDEVTFQNYCTGYQHIAERIKKESPDARVWLLRPSPYDDVTRPPAFEGGYNGILMKYGDYVLTLATENGFGNVNLNAPMVAMLQHAKDIDPEAAKQIIPDRVHPTAGHIEMANEILKEWHATPIVSNTTIDWTNGQAATQSSSVSHWSNGSFTLLEDSLPMPFDRKDPTTALVLKSCDADASLNEELLTVKNMPAGNYSLSIDGKSIGTFSDQQFSSGIDLAQLDTPMYEQSKKVGDLSWRLINLRTNRWRNIDFTLQDLHLREVADADRGHMILERALARKRDELARPIPHEFSIAAAQ